MKVRPAPTKFPHLMTHLPSVRLAACAAIAHGDIQEDGTLAQLQGGFALWVRDAVRLWQSPLLRARCHQPGAPFASTRRSRLRSRRRTGRSSSPERLGVDLYAGLVLGNCCVALDQPRHDTTSCLSVREQWSGAQVTKALEKTPLQCCAPSAV